MTQETIDPKKLQMLQEILSDPTQRASFGLSIWASTNNTLSVKEQLYILGSFFLSYLKEATLPGYEEDMVQKLADWARQKLVTDTGSSASPVIPVRGDGGGLN